MNAINKVLSGVVQDFVEEGSLVSRRYFYEEDIEGDDPVKMKKPVVKVTFEYIDLESEEISDPTIVQRDSYSNLSIVPDKKHRSK